MLLYLCFSMYISSFKGFSDGLGQFSLICIGVTDKICNPEKTLQWGEKIEIRGRETKDSVVVGLSQEDLGNQSLLVYVFLFIFWHKALLILSWVRCRDNGWQDTVSAIQGRITLRVSQSLGSLSAGWLSAPRRHPSSTWKLIVFHYSLMPQYLQLSQTMTKSSKQTER